MSQSAILNVKNNQRKIEYFIKNPKICIAHEGAKCYLYKHRVDLPSTET